MKSAEFHTLAELATKHNLKKPTLVARVKARSIPHRKIGNTITILAEHVDMLTKNDRRSTPLRDEFLYRKWSRYKRLGGMEPSLHRSFDVFAESMMKLPNASPDRRLKRIDRQKGCFVGNMHWV